MLERVHIYENVHLNNICEDVHNLISDVTIDHSKTQCAACRRRYISFH